MRFLQHLIKINDVYFISDIIKNINPNLDIFYNKNTCIYEVHDTSKFDSFIISYSKYPDQNLIKKLYQTSKENSKKYLDLIQKENEKLLENQNKKLLDDANARFNEIMSFAEKSSNELSLSAIKKIIKREEKLWPKKF